MLLLLGLLVVRSVAGQEPPEASAIAAQEPAAEKIAEAPGVGSDPEARLAELERRCLEAEARTRAADLALAGAIPVEEAFPDLLRAPLDSVAWVTGRLDELDQRGKALAAERRAELSVDEEGEPLRAARDAAHRALMQADEMERRFLLAVLVHLEENEQLTRPALASVRLDLAVSVDTAEAFFEDADPSSVEQRAREVVIAQREVAWLDELQRGLLLHSTVGAPPPRPERDVAIVDDPAAEPVAVEMAEFRLGLLMPFLGDRQRIAVTEALARRQQAEAAAAEVAEAPADVAGEQESAAERHAGVETAAAVAREAAKSAQDRLRQRVREISQQMSGFDKTLEESRDEALEIAARDPSGEDPHADADDLYRRLRGLVSDMLQAVGDAGRLSIEADRGLAVARGDAARARPEIERLEKDAEAGAIAPAPGVFAGRGRALDQRIEAAAALLELEQDHRDQVFVVLKDAKALRRGLEPEVSGKAIREDRINLLDDLRAEADLVGPNMRALARHRWSTLVALPSQWRDEGIPRAVLISVFWVLFAGVLWLVLRRQAPAAIPRQLRLWGARDKRYVPSDLRRMTLPAQRTSKALVDLAAGAALLRLAAPGIRLPCGA